MNRITKLSWRPVSAAVGVALASLVAGSAWAGDEDSPLSLTLSQTVNHDSNFTRNDLDRHSEITGTTAIEARLNKEYGRQNYRGGLKLYKQKYHNYGQRDNDGKQANFSLTSEVGADWIVSGNTSYSETLNPIQNNNTGEDRLAKNIVKYRDGGLDVQFGNGGAVAVIGSIGGYKRNFSIASQQYQNASQSSGGLRVVYYPTDLLNYSLGVSQETTKYPNNPSYDETKDRDINFSTNWQVTGLSNLSATLTRRSTSYVPANLAGNKSWTGAFNWQYSPQGIFLYKVGLTRSTGADRSKTEGLLLVNNRYATASEVNSDTVTTALNASATADLTGKLSLTVSQSVTQFKLDRAVLNSYVGSVSNEPERRSASSYNHSTSAYLGYAAMRSLNLGCGYQIYSQGSDAYHLKYSGRSVDCNASFTLDSLF